MRKYLVIYREERKAPIKVEFVKTNQKEELFDQYKGNGFRVIDVLSAKQFRKIIENEAHRLHDLLLDIKGNGLLKAK
jgi:hypothetical protein